MEKDVKNLEDLDDELEANIDHSVKRLGGFFVRFVGLKVQLVHETARDFLLRSSSPNYYSLDPKSCNVVLADRCIRFLILDGWVQYWQRIRACDSPGKLLLEQLQPQHREFYQYAASNRFIHLREAGIRIQKELEPSGGKLAAQKLHNLVRKMCSRDQGYLQAWWSIYVDRGCFSISAREHHFLHLAVSDGALTLLQCFLASNGFCITDKGIWDYDVLGYAAHAGKEDIVCWVLKEYHGADLQYGTALIESLWRGNVLLVEMLLQCDIDLNRDYKFVFDFGCPMRPLATAIGCSCSIHVLEILVNKGADVLIVSPSKWPSTAATWMLFVGCFTHQRDGRIQHEERKCLRQHWRPRQGLDNWEWWI